MKKPYSFFTPLFFYMLCRKRSCHGALSVIPVCRRAALKVPPQGGAADSQMRGNDGIVPARIVFDILYGLSEVRCFCIGSYKTGMALFKFMKEPVLPYGPAAASSSEVEPGQE